jgi:transposase-like protein
MRGRYFKPEFKLHCCQLVETDGMKVSEVCKQFDLDRQVLHTWLKLYRELGSEAFSENGMLSKDAVIRKQEREIRKLQEANEILKKAIAYCKQKKND